MDDLTKIGIKYNTDKATFHNYTGFYNEYFKTVRNEKLTILEIGILNGNSLLTLQEYFPNAEIHAVDIVPKSVKEYGSRIHTYLCSQVDEDKLNELFSDMEFDIIVDDGSHLTLHQLQSFGFLFKKLKSGGLYVCEDLHTSLHKNYINSTTIPLDIFKNYDGKKLEIPEISTEDNEYINEHIKEINVYKREVNAYMCYACNTVCNHEYEKCKSCNIDLSPENSSYTSIIVKK